MEDRYSIARPRSGIWKSLRDGDFEEEEIWDVLNNKHDYSSGVVVKPKDKKPSSLSAPRSIPTAARMIPRSTTSSSSSKNSCSSSSHESKFLPQSAPVNIPHWSNIHRNSRNNASKNVSRFYGNVFYGHSVGDEDDDCDDGSVNCDGDSDDGDEYDLKLPPHEFIAKRLAKSSLSVLEGAGRTLKGRDLSIVRNAVLTKTGFLE